jgi:hypothetical protein
MFPSRRLLFWGQIFCLIPLFFSSSVHSTGLIQLCLVPLGFYRAETRSAEKQNQPLEQDAIWAIRAIDPEGSAPFQKNLERNLAESPIKGPMTLIGEPTSYRPERQVFRVNLENGLRGIWKPNTSDGLQRGEADVAVYRLSEALKLGVVPATVMREKNGKMGSLQCFVSGKEASFDSFDRLDPRIKVLDLLSGNFDRVQDFRELKTWVVRKDNIREGPDGGQIAIDNGAAFQRGEVGREIGRITSRQFRKNPGAYDPGLEPLRLMKRMTLKQTLELFPDTFPDRENVAEELHTTMNWVADGIIQVRRANGTAPILPVRIWDWGLLPR